MTDEQPIQDQPTVETTPSPAPEAGQSPASDVQVPAPESTPHPAPSADLSEPVNTEIPQQETQSQDQQSEQQQTNTEPVQQNVSEQTLSAPSANPSPSSTPSIPSLAYPFYGSFPVSFAFGAQPTDENIKKKYAEWRLVGHNGIDFVLPEGTDVLSCDDGTVTQAGDNGDFGISVTIQHSWGMSLYAHLKEHLVSVGQQLKKSEKTGASGHTGFVTADHLHVGIQPTSPDTNNGYLGYIDPAPYLTETVSVPEKPQESSTPTETSQPTPPQEQPQQTPSPEQTPAAPPAEQSPTQESPELSAQPDLSVPEPLQTPESSQPPPSISYEIPNFGSEQQNKGETHPAQENIPEIAAHEPSLIEQQAVAMFDARVKENQAKGNAVKKARKEAHLAEIMAFAQVKRQVTNEQVRELLHVSQSTATAYLQALVSGGQLRVDGKAKNTIYLY